jgi:hypothetical protein
VPLPESPVLNIEQMRRGVDLQKVQKHFHIPALASKL